MMNDIELSDDSDVQDITPVKQTNQGRPNRVNNYAEQLDLQVMDLIDKYMGNQKNRQNFNKLKSSTSFLLYEDLLILKSLKKYYNQVKGKKLYELIYKQFGNKRAQISVEERLTKKLINVQIPELKRHIQQNMPFKFNKNKKCIEGEIKTIPHSKQIHKSNTKEIDNQKETNNQKKQQPNFRQQKMIPEISSNLNELPSTQKQNWEKLYDILINSRKALQKDQKLYLRSKYLSEGNLKSIIFQSIGKDNFICYNVQILKQKLTKSKEVDRKQQIELINLVSQNQMNQDNLQNQNIESIQQEIFVDEEINIDRQLLSRVSNNKESYDKYVSDKSEYSYLWWSDQEDELLKQIICNGNFFKNVKMIQKYKPIETIMERVSFLGINMNTSSTNQN